MISIVLPAYNEAKRIKKAVERVINTLKLDIYIRTRDLEGEEH